MIRFKDAVRDGENALKAAARLEWKNQQFSIIAAGWQWNRKGRQRPIIGYLNKEAGHLNCEMTFKNRLWHYPRIRGVPTTLVSAPSGNLKNIEREQLVERLQDQTCSVVTEMLVDEIRRVSKLNPYVGPDVLSVAISPPQIGKIIVADHAVLPRQHTVKNSFAGDRVLPVAVTPWVVAAGTPPQVPSIHSHPDVLSAGKYEVFLPGPPQPGGMYFSGSLPRVRS
jgi:hypothetical protein